jgi:hypothetical protein
VGGSCPPSTRGRPAPNFLSICLGSIAGQPRRTLARGDRRESVGEIVVAHVPRRFSTMRTPALSRPCSGPAARRGSRIRKPPTAAGLARGTSRAPSSITPLPVARRRLAASRNLQPRSFSCPLA